MERTADASLEAGDGRVILTEKANGKDGSVGTNVEVRKDGSVGTKVEVSVN